MSSVVYQPDYVPTNFNRGVVRTSIVLPGHLVVYGFTFTNTNAAAQFVLAFDAATLPADGAVPLLGASCSGSDAKGFSWGTNGREFLSGLVLCNSSTLATKTLGSADCLFDVQYDVISDGGTVVSAEG